MEVFFLGLKNHLKKPEHLSGSVCCGRVGRYSDSGLEEILAPAWYRVGARRLCLNE